MKKILLLVCALILALSTLSFADMESFSLNFPDCYLVYVPQNGTLQITANLSVLSYGSDWTVTQVYPYLYHLKLNTWQGFYWMVNTSRKEAYRVTNGTFGRVGGQQTRLNVVVDVVGGSVQTPPDRFFIRFNGAYLIYSIGNQEIQVIAQGNVLSYGSNWQKAQIYPYLFHIRLGTWQGFFWKVNTSRLQVYEVRNGTFGAIAAGQETTLNIPVTTR